MMFPAFCKMRAKAHTKGIQYYRCRAKDFECVCARVCAQGGIQVKGIDEQVVNFLKVLMPPLGWRDNITRSISNLLGEKSLQERLNQIYDAIERMDFRWDSGFITDRYEYLEKRLRLQQELETLTPIPHDDLERAVDQLANFEKYLDTCKDESKAQSE